MPDPCIPPTQRVPWASAMSSFAHMVTIYRNAWHFPIRYDSPRMASIAVRAMCRTILPLNFTYTGAGGSSHRQRTRLDHFSVQRQYICAHRHHTDAYASPYEHVSQAHSGLRSTRARHRFLAAGGRSERCRGSGPGAAARTQCSPR